MKYCIIVLLGIIAFLGFSACESEKEDFDVDFGYSYYPMQEGEYWNYRVDSVVYRNGGNTRDTTSSFIREEIAETFVDVIGDTVHRIERFHNPEYNDDWFVTDEWFSQNDETRVLRTEENLKYIKMVFPPLEGERWDGNAFIDESIEITVGGETLSFFLSWDYRILSVNQPDTIDGMIFDNVLTIQNADNFRNIPDSLQPKLNRRYVIEKYAKNIGLIYKKHMILDSQCTSLACDSIPWEEKAEQGYIMEMTLLEHGK